jgi:endonuclease/exonuclease/phosphatase family metal-dependent hydrolase
LKPGFLFLLNIFISIITVLLYYSSHIPPAELWIAAFLSLLIPAFIILNIVFCIYWLFKNRNRALLSLMVIIAGYSFISRTFSWSFRDNSEVRGLKVINYNVRIFNTYTHLQDANRNSSKKMMEWLVNSDAGILSLQEFYYDKSSDIYNSIDRIRKSFPYYYYDPNVFNQINASFGMAIFSKSRIVNKGNLQLNERSNNQIIFVDVLFQKDTIRIYNIHLQSMSIEESHFTYSLDSWKAILKKLRKGAVQRTSQINALADHVKACPYPVIVTGDLNDTPYSYSYQVLRTRLNNSFEKAGRGMGFTYNGKLYLRIDNQFASPELKIERFTTYTDIKYSDHFPLEGVYSVDR